MTYLVAQEEVEAYPVGSIGQPHESPGLEEQAFAMQHRYLMMMQRFQLPRTQTQLVVVVAELAVLLGLHCKDLAGMASEELADPRRNCEQLDKV